jgi:hypothetical protein
LIAITRSRDDNLAENAGRILARSAQSVKGKLSVVHCSLSGDFDRQCYQAVETENNGQRTTNHGQIQFEFDMAADSR